MPAFYSPCDISTAIITFVSLKKSVMKRFLLLLVFILAAKFMQAQVSCNFTYTQAGNTVTFYLPVFPMIYSVDSLVWNFGDGGSVSQSMAAGTLTMNVSHTYMAPGIYNACLLIWLTPLGGTQISCTSCTPITIGGTAACNATYIFTQAGNVVNFTSTSSGPGPITGHSWNFGDGSPLSNAVNPSHTYSSAGNYVVCHTIQGGSSTSGAFSCTYCDTITIGAAPCNASYSYTQSGNVVNFTSTSSGPGTITSHSWNFGDGSPLSNLANPSHTYASSGVFTACHTILGVDSNGVSFTCTSCSTITVNLPVPCNASYIFTQAGSSVIFTSTSSGPGTITNHTWVFGDGTPNSNLANPTHTYALPGNYVACHTISGSSSAGAFNCTFCDTITIAGTGTGCTANANFSSSTGGPGGLVASFSNMSNCTGCASMVYSWNFGDGSPASILSNPTHTYASAGTYTVCLVMNGVDSSGGLCSDTTCKPITVGPSGVNDLGTASLNFHPNPAQQLVSCNLPAGSRIASLTIMDLCGRKIQNLPHNLSVNHELTLDFNGMTDGVYFIYLKLSNGRSLTGKIVLDH